MRGKRASVKRALRALAAAGAVCLTAGAAEAQSRFACSDLDRAATPVFEGETGIFFRPDPDLVSETRLPQFVIDRIGAISDALASRGTRLVVVPIPTKGLIHADEIGPEGAIFGFDVDLARTLWNDTHARLALAGVTSVDALEALTSLSEARPVFATDPRLTNSGIRAIAELTGRSLGAPARSRRIKMVAAGSAAVPSVQHQQIQAQCNISIPLPRTISFDTVSLTASEPEEHALIVGAGAMSGTGLAAETLFEAALSQGVSHVVTEGRPLEAILQVLAGDSFQTAPPDTLIWTFPIETDLARHGVRPFLEAAGLARHGCREIAPMLVDREEGRVLVDLTAAASVSDIGVMLTMPDSPRDAIAYTLHDDAGAARSRSLIRHGGATTRFLIPMGTADLPGATSLEITVPGPMTTVPSVAFCGV